MCSRCSYLRILICKRQFDGVVLEGECSCFNSFIKCVVKFRFILKHPRCKNECLCSEGNNAASLRLGIPWDECTQSISAPPNSFSKCNQFIQSSNVVSLYPLRSCPSSSLKFFSLLVIKASHLGWDLALKRNQRSGGNPCRALLYLYVDEPGGKFPEMLDLLLDLPEGSAWLLCFKALL